MSLRVRAYDAERVFEDVLARVDRSADLRPVMTEIGRMQRMSVRAEFRSESFFRKKGGRQPWKKTQAFGRRRSPSKTLQRSGDLKGAWLGTRPGGIFRVHARSVEVGVDGNEIEYLARVRGGTTQDLDTRDYLVKPRKLANSRSNRQLTGAQRYAMFWAVLRQHGVALTERTLERGMAVTPRPHGVFHQKLRDAAGRRVREFVTTGTFRKTRSREVQP